MKDYSCFQIEAKLMTDYQNLVNLF